MLPNQFLWALSGALGLFLLRLLILGVGGDYLSAPYALGGVIALFGYTLWFSVVSFLTFAKWKTLRIAGWMLTGLVAFVHLIAFHYESVFGRYPSAALLYYIGELKHLRSSIFEHASPLWVTVELVAIISVLAIARARVSFKGISRRSALLATLSIVLLTTLVHWKPQILPPSFFWGSQNPVFWTIRDRIEQASYAFNEVTFNRKDVAKVQLALGAFDPSAGEVAKYPLCSNRALSASKGNGRSVILVILEGIERELLDMDVDGQPVMPNLRRIERENLSFTNFFAAGNKSCQAFPALFAGLPAQTHENVFWVPPLVRLRGWPGILKQAGYRTGFFHGGDLSFEQQREFLKNVGFSELHELDPFNEDRVWGWGFDDGYMLEKLARWVDTHRENSKQTPYLATIATLSSHDPFVIPVEWPRRFSNLKLNSGNMTIWNDFIEKTDRRRVAAEAYAFTDHHMGLFYDWYLNNERPRGTILVITSDHGSSTGAVEIDPKHKYMKYRMPFIIAGLDNTDPLDRFKTRLASAMDVPATLSGLLDVDTHPCSQGLNLLSDQWPSNRTVYAVGGEHLEHVYFWRGPHQFHFDVKLASLSRIEREPAEVEANQDRAVVLRETADLITALYPLNAYLLRKNAYFPADEADAIPQRRPADFSAPMVIASHRGNVTGPDPKYENTWAALEKVVNSRFEWVEIDLQITRDDVIVLHHDDHLEINGQKRFIFNMSIEQLRGYKNVPTLKDVLNRYGDKINFLLEAKPQPFIGRRSAMARQISRMVNELPKDREVIVDSFSSHIVASVEAQCERCQTAWDLPQIPPTEEMFRYASKQGFDWIYIEESHLTENVIRKAHEFGLKVMVYTVNNPKSLLKWLNPRPDGVITDTEAIFSGSLAR